MIQVHVKKKAGFLLVLVLLAGCADGPATRILGNWRYLGPDAEFFDGALEFRGDGQVVTSYRGRTPDGGMKRFRRVDPYRIEGEQILIDERSHRFRFENADTFFLEANDQVFKYRRIVER